MNLLKVIPLLFNGAITKARYEDGQYSEVLTMKDDELTMYTVEGFYIHNHGFLVSDFSMDWIVSEKPGLEKEDLDNAEVETFPLLTHIPALIREEVEFLTAKDKDGEDIYLYLGEKEEPLPGMDEVETPIDFMFEDEEGVFQVFQPDLTKQLFKYDWKPVKGVKE